MRSIRVSFVLAAVMVLAAMLSSPPPATAYVEVPYPLGKIVAEATNIVVMKVDKVDKEKNLIIYSKVADLKGKHNGDVIKHQIGKAGFHAREWQFIMDWAEVGKTAVFFHNGGASETCINNYWYQAYPGGEWWTMSHAEPYLLRSFAGSADKLVPAVKAILENKEVVVPCMVDGDKNALQLRTAKIQRLKASLKIQDYDPKRDFVGWGGEDFRALEGLPAFGQYASVSRTDPGAIGAAVIDFDGDGKPDICLYGLSKVVLLQNAGTSLNEVGLPYGGGARQASWADYDGDGKPDLLLATPTGPKLLTNKGGTFKDDTALIPPGLAYNATCCAWINYDGDKHPDILFGTSFEGLQLYRHKGSVDNSAATPVKLGKWSYLGPFDHSDRKGFEREFEPEKEAFDPKKEYTGKGDMKLKWKEHAFADGQAHNLRLFDKDELNTWSVIYLYREIECAIDVEMPISLGSDDTITVWHNDKKIISENVYRGAAPDQNKAVLKLKKGKNSLLIKICQGDADWAFYFNAQVPTGPVTPLFEDVTGKAGLGPNGLAGGLKGDFLAVADVDGDGRQDVLYSAGDGVLLLNTPNGLKESKDSGIKFVAGKVVPLFTDFDGDKTLDLLVPQPNGVKLFKGDGKGKFVDVTAKAGDLAKLIERAACVCVADFDKNGKPGIFVGCVGGMNRYYRHQGEAVFAEAGEEIGLNQKMFNSRAIAVGDLNKDGVPDLILNNEGTESAVLLGKPNRFEEKK